MADAGVEAAKPIPSYLIECLAYRVDDIFCTEDNDDHFNRIYWIVRSLQNMAIGPGWPADAMEINDLKRLFGSWQGGPTLRVVAFLAAARAYLEA
jgi:hypothetical protein